MVYANNLQVQKKDLIRSKQSNSGLDRNSDNRLESCNLTRHNRRIRGQG